MSELPAHVAMTQPPWRMKELGHALGGLMAPGVLGWNHLAALIAYWEKRGELGPYPRDAHGHRRFGPEDLSGIEECLTRWHRKGIARSARYRAVPLEVRERERTLRAERRHGERMHGGPFEACRSRLCFAYTPKAVAFRAEIDRKVAARRAAEESG